MNRAGKAIGFYGMYNTGKEHIPILLNFDSNSTGENVQSGMEIFSSVVSVFGGSYGAAWGIGWEAGRLITEQDWYNEMKEQWIYEKWRKENLGY